MDLTIIKKHPYASGGIIIVGAVILYLLLRSGSSSTSSAVTTAGATGPSAADLQMASLQAGYNIQAANIQAGVQTAQISADVQNNQTAAALQANEVQVAASLKAALDSNSTAIRQSEISTQGTVDLATINASATVAESKIAADQAVALTNSQNALWESAINAGVTENQSNNDVAVAIANDQTILGVTGIQAKSQLDNAVVGLVKSGQLNKGGQGGQNQLAVVDALYGGNPAEVVAAAQPSNVASSGSALLGGIAKVGSVITQGLFA